MSKSETFAIKWIKHILYNTHLKAHKKCQFNLQSQQLSTACWARNIPEVSELSSENFRQTD